MLTRLIINAGNPAERLVLMKELISKVVEVAGGLVQFEKPAEPMLEFFRKVTQRYTVKMNADNKPVIGEDGKPVLIPDGKPFKEVRLYTSKFKAYDKKAGRTLTFEGYMPFNKRLALLLVNLGIGAWTTASGLTEEEDDAIFGEVEETPWVVEDATPETEKSTDTSDVAVVSE